MSFLIFLAMGLALAQQAELTAVGTVSELMKALVIPSSDVIFDAGLNEPADDDAWERVEHNAIILAEAGNLLMMESRSEGREPWIEASQAMLEAGQASLEAARARDVEALFDISEQILESCSSCHSVYWN